jgi:transposase InsO family protein
MGRVGDCWDSAVAEGFVATLKTELIHRRPWPTKSRARSAIHDYIGAFFNPHRRHSSIGHVGAMDFEKLARRCKRDSISATAYESGSTAIVSPQLPSPCPETSQSPTQSRS